jgi:hypothetical protein
MMEFFIDTERANGLQQGRVSAWPANPTTRAAIAASSLSGRISISDCSILTDRGTGNNSLTSACHLLISSTHQSFHHRESLGLQDRSYVEQTDT